MLMPRWFAISRSRGEWFFIIAVIAVINWAANFYLFKNFGLYVDDYSRIPQIMTLAESGILEQLARLFSIDFNIRPLHSFFIYFLSLIGFKVGGLEGIYIMGYLILTLNTVLCFQLIKRISDNPVCALFGALVFCLYPVSAVKIWLTALLGIQPALTLLLISLHLYASDKKIAAYLVAFSSLFCYETIFLVFAAAPLLKKDFDRKLLGRLIVHISITFSIFIAFAIFKAVLSDPRIENLGVGFVIQRSLNNTIAGPLFNIKRHVSIPIKTLLSLPVEQMLYPILLSIGFFILFDRMYKWSSGGVQLVNHTIPPENRELPTISSASGRLILIGFIMLFLAYPITFYGNIRHSTGIASRIHVAGTLGMALLGAGCFTVLHDVLHFLKARALAGLIIAVYLSSLVIYNFSVQQDYRLSRNLQSEFWSQVITLCPDATEETTIFVRANDFPEAKSISSISWSVCWILDKIYVFPVNWRFPPRLYLLMPTEGTQRLVSDFISASYMSDLNQAGHLAFLSPSDRDRPVDLSNIIVLRYIDGSLKRLSRLDDGAGNAYPVKALSADIMNHFHKNVLYSHLIQGKK